MVLTNGIPDLAKLIKTDLNHSKSEVILHVNIYREPKLFAKKKHRVLYGEK